MSTATKSNQAGERTQSLKQEQQRMEFLRGTLANDLRGFNMDEQADLLGFLLNDYESGRSLFTVYCAPDNLYSVYSAIDDVHRGIKVEDEKPLLLNARIGSVITAIRNEQRRLGLTTGEKFANYFGVETPSEGVQRQWKGRTVAA